MGRTYSLQKLFSFLLALVLWGCLPASAQRVIATLPVGMNPWGIAVNPNTHKVYVVNQCYSCQNGNTVTVIDEDTFATATVPIGSQTWGETPIAVNKTTNKIYVANSCGNDWYCRSNGTVTVIDGATLATTTVQVGYRPEALAINETTNQIFVVNACGNGDCIFQVQTLTIIDGTTLSTTSIATGYGFYNIAPAVAVNPATNKVFVVNPCGTDQGNCRQGNVMMVDPVTLTNTSIPVGRDPNIVIVNSATNKIYVGGDTYINASITQIDGGTLSTSTVLLQEPAIKLALNEATNKIYVVCSDMGYGLDSQLAVIDGVTLATSFYPLPPYADGLAINTTTNKAYISSEVDPYSSSNGFLTVFDGSNHSLVNLTVGFSPVDVALDETNNRIYAENNCATSNCGGGVQGSVTVVDGTPLPPWQFIPVTPCRVVDTRNPDGPFGGPPIQGGRYRDFPLPQGSCGIPPTATAYALNATVVPRGAPELHHALAHRTAAAISVDHQLAGRAG